MHFRFQAQDRPKENTNVLALQVGERRTTVTLRHDSTYREVATDLRRLAEWVERQQP